MEIRQRLPLEQPQFQLKSEDLKKVAQCNVLFALDHSDLNRAAKRIWQFTELQLPRSIRSIGNVTYTSSYTEHFLTSLLAIIKKNITLKGDEI